MTQNEVKTCYKIDDDSGAFECIKQVVRAGKSEDGCAPRIVLLYKDGCPGCAEEKERLKADISEGVVVPVDIHSQEGIEIAARNDIDAVPAVLILDCKNKLIDLD